jgi:hypothetical protein
MEIDKLIEGADLLRHNELNDWDIYNEWTKQDQPESY